VADLGTLHDATGRDSLDDVSELLQQISSQLCRAPIPNVYWAVLEQSAIVDHLIFCVHPSMQPDFLTRTSLAAAHRLPMPRGARVICRPRPHYASSLLRLYRIPTTVLRNLLMIPASNRRQDLISQFICEMFATDTLCDRFARLQSSRQTVALKFFLLLISNETAFSLTDELRQYLSRFGRNTGDRKATEPIRTSLSMEVNPCGVLVSSCDPPDHKGPAHFYGIRVWFC
jgi:hypothetical protein